MYWPLLFLFIVTPVASAEVLTASCTELDPTTGRATGGRINVYTEGNRLAEQGKRYITKVKIVNIPRLEGFGLNPLQPTHQVQTNDLLNFHLQRYSAEGKVEADLDLWFNFADKLIPPEHFNAEVDSVLNILKNTVGAGVTHEDLDRYAVGNHDLLILNNNSYRNARKIPMSFQCFELTTNAQRHMVEVFSGDRNGNTDGRSPSRRTSGNQPRTEVRPE